MSDSKLFINMWKTTIQDCFFCLKKNFTGKKQTFSVVVNRQNRFHHDTLVLCILSTHMWTFIYAKSQQQKTFLLVFLFSSLHYYFTYMYKFFCSLCIINLNWKKEIRVMNLFLSHFQCNQITATTII